MTRKEAEAQAEEYINKVVASQKAFGFEPDLSDSEYRRAVNRAAQAMTDTSQSGRASEPAEDVPA